MIIVYYNILLDLLLETLAIGWFFDAEKIIQHFSQNSTLKIGGIWKIAIRYLIPIILLLLLFLQAKSDLLINYNDYPWWALLIFGVGTIFVPIVVAFLMPQKILDMRY